MKLAIVYPLAMKTLFFSFIITLTISSTFAQSSGLSIRKGDNVFIIETPLRADSAFGICSRFLAQKGYSFQSRDAELRQIVTNERSYLTGRNYKLTIVCLDERVKVRASIEAILESSTYHKQRAWSDWYYLSSAKFGMKQAFYKFYPDILELKTVLSGDRIYSARE